MSHCKHFIASGIQDISDCLSYKVTRLPLFSMPNQSCQRIIFNGVVTSQEFLTSSTTTLCKANSFEQVPTLGLLTC